MKDVPPVIDVGTDGTDIVGCASNRKIESALLILGREKFRRLPITKLGKIEGILTITDIFGIIAKVGLTQAFKETISDWMTVNPKKIDLNSSVVEAIKMMGNLKIGSLLLVDKESPELCKGIITERDILYYYDTSLWEDTLICNMDRYYLSMGFIIIDYDTSLEDSINMMSEKRTHRLIVKNKDGGGIYGMLTANDITSLITREREEIHNNSNFLTSITAGFVSSGRVITIKNNVSVKEAVEIMRKERFGSLPIMDEQNKLSGMITERSLLFYIADRQLES